MLAILISESPIFRPRFVCQPGGDQIVKYVPAPPAWKATPAPCGWKSL